MYPRKNNIGLDTECFFWLISDFQILQNKLEIEGGGASEIAQTTNWQEKTICLLSLLAAKAFLWCFGSFILTFQR